MTRHRLAVFEGRIITNARPPITADEKRDIERRIEGEIPPGLLRLWKTSFGGNLDYDLFIQYPSGLHPLSFTQLFYPDSDDYRTLIEWMEFEEERMDEAYEEAGKKWTGKLNVIPFGGFEYLERVYAVTSPAPEAGKILVWSQGLPPAWTGRLTEDSEAVIANNISGLFKLLRHYHDPFRFAEEDDYETGLELVEAIEPLKSEGTVGKMLAGRLLDLLRATHYDWKARLEAGTLIGDDIGETIALEAALADDDLALIKRLGRGKLDFSKRRRGGMNTLDMAANSRAIECFNWLLEKGVQTDRTFEFSAGQLKLDQVEKLLSLNAPLHFNALAYSASQASHLDAFEHQCRHFSDQNPDMRIKLAEKLRDIAQGEIQYANKMRSGKASSYRSAEETEQHGKALLEIANTLHPLPEVSQAKTGNWLSRIFRSF